MENARDRSSIGFIRAMARELLVHNTKVNTVDEAIELAELLLDKTGVNNVGNNTYRS